MIGVGVYVGTYLDVDDSGMYSWVVLVAKSKLTLLLLTGIFSVDIDGLIPLSEGFLLLLLL